MLFGVMSIKLNLQAQNVPDSYGPGSNLRRARVRGLIARRPPTNRGPLTKQFPFIFRSFSYMYLRKNYKSQFHSLIIIYHYLLKSALLHVYRHSNKN